MTLVRTHLDIIETINSNQHVISLELLAQLVNALTDRSRLQVLLELARIDSYWERADGHRAVFVNLGASCEKGAPI